LARKCFFLVLLLYTKFRKIYQTSPNIAKLCNPEISIPEIARIFAKMWDTFLLPIFLGEIFCLILVKEYSKKYLHVFKKCTLQTDPIRHCITNHIHVYCFSVLIVYNYGLWKHRPLTNEKIVHGVNFVQGCESCKTVSFIKVDRNDNCLLYTKIKSLFLHSDIKVIPQFTHIHYTQY
jgi:hypothetical protein